MRDRAAKARERAGEVRVVAQERASKAAGRASEAGAKMRARVTDEYRRRQAARDPGAEEGRGRGFRTLARPEGDFRERAKGVSTRFRE